MHYYLYEYTGAEGYPQAIIFEDYSEDSETPGAEFVEVTLEQLHQRGYLTATEQLVQHPTATIDIHSDGGFRAESWLTTWVDNNGWKWYDGGGKTIRPDRGQLYLDMWYQILNADGQLVNLLDPGPKRRRHSDSLSWHHTGYHGPNVTHSHFVKGEHAFQVPPEAIIYTHAEGKW
ncbi:MAG: hypothetical protein ABIK38_00825 [candidate division WOR-3 bacterium]